jgi:hypothetical protein
MLFKDKTGNPIWVAVLGDVTACKDSIDFIKSQGGEAMKSKAGIVFDY